jgi:hypothetical protein
MGLRKAADIKNRGQVSRPIDNSEVIRAPLSTPSHVPETDFEDHKPTSVQMLSHLTHAVGAVVSGRASGTMGTHSKP